MYLSKKLTLKQKKFADEYIISGNATESYKLAGYKYSSDNMAGVESNKLLRNPKVKEYIDKKMAKMDEDSIAKAKEVLQYLTSVLRGETYDEVYYKTDLGGEALGKVQVQNKDRIKAAELLMKRLGINVSELDILKQKAQIDKTEAETSRIKGISEEVEDLSDIDGVIYGKD